MTTSSSQSFPVYQLSILTLYGLIIAIAVVPGQSSREVDVAVPLLMLPVYIYAAFIQK